MNKFPRIACLIFAIVLSALFSLQPAQAEPPSRVARLSYVNGELIFSPAGENRWVNASLNRPLIVGDRLFSHEQARAELQLSGARVFIASNTSLRILNLNEKNTQFKLTQGRLQLNIRANPPYHSFEVDTPNLAFVIKEPGIYSIIVEPEGKATIVGVKKGKAVAYGKEVAYSIGNKQQFRFTGTSLKSQRVTRKEDSFDRFCANRTASKITTVKYVSPEVIGYEDLDVHGTWVKNSRYGYMWQPRVSSSWVPYREGHWAWIEPWGWTWVDNQPWGFAPFHYGRWVYVSTRWYWVPGPRTARAVYAPALVAFVGTPRAQAQVAWFPLGPGDVYRPAYSTSRDYFMRVNLSNMAVRQNVVSEFYAQPQRPVTYHNRQFVAAVTAVPATTFVQSQPVAQANVVLKQDVLKQAPIENVAPVAPSAASVAGNSQKVEQPPEKTLDVPVVVQNTPAPPVIPFAEQEKKLAADPGKPLDQKVLESLKPEKPSTAETVIVAPEVKPAVLPATNEAPVEVSLPKEPEPEQKEVVKEEAPKVDEGAKVEEAPKVDDASKTEEAAKVEEAPKGDKGSKTEEAPKAMDDSKGEEVPAVEQKEVQGPPGTKSPDEPSIPTRAPEQEAPLASEPPKEEPPVIEAPKNEVAPGSGTSDRMEVPPAPEKPPVEGGSPMREIPQSAKDRDMERSSEPVAPSPQPEPVPQPKPAPVPVPQPEPAPVPQPEPAPVPVPQPEPAPVPAPQPEPAPVPQPEPAPVPAPQPEPAPVPQPEPAPVPVPQPEPIPAPPVVEPAPEAPVPAPDGTATPGQ